jgi:hypothetical protein
MLCGSVLAAFISNKRDELAFDILPGSAKIERLNAEQVALDREADIDGAVSERITMTKRKEKTPTEKLREALVNMTTAEDIQRVAK